MKNISLLMTISIMIIAIASVAQVTGTYTDSRDGKTYKTVKIGDQWWMAENLAYKADNGCWAFNNDQNNVSTYGYLYNWQAAKSVCPNGWKLPSIHEWNKLLEYCNIDDNANMLKSSITWHGTDDYGFNALPSGSRHSNGSFDAMGSNAYWWTSSVETGANVESWYRYIFNSNNYNIGTLTSSRESGFSVRCLCSNAKEYEILVSEAEKRNNPTNINTNTTIADNTSSQQTLGCISGDCYNGYGTYIYKSGVKYVGNFKDGTAYGKGKLYYINGKIYEGDFVWDYMDGYGTNTYPDGSKYVGQFKKSEMTGYGVYTWPNGDKYEGEFLEGSRTGKGKYIWQNGETYNGDFLTNTRTGYGTQIDSDGTKYIGYFKNNYYHGTGKIYDKNGNWLYDGEWNYGVLKEKPKVTTNVSPTDDWVGLGILSGIIVGTCAIIYDIASSDNGSSDNSSDEKSPPSNCCSDLKIGYKVYNCAKYSRPLSWDEYLSITGTIEQIAEKKIHIKVTSIDDYNQVYNGEKLHVGDVIWDDCYRWYYEKPNDCK